MNKVIAYYPGAGGCRLRNKLTGVEYQRTGIVYDEIYLEHRYRYLIGDYSLPLDDDIVQLHCMNIDLIRSVIPNAYIYMIRSNFKQSLMRYWISCDKNNKQFDNVLDNAFNCIAWHVDYYNKYPIQETADEYIDIDSTNEFGNMMLTEFNNTDEIFELAWYIYHEQGPKAPIIDIWNQLNDKK